MSFRQIAKDIKALKIQGASNVARAGLKAYSLKPTKSSIRKLLSLRPTEPMLRNALYYAEKYSVKDALNLVNRNREKTVEHGKKFIKGKKRIFTHCHSSTVVDVLKLNKRLKVFNTETRPLFQGRRTTEELSEAGINVTQIVDSAAHDYIKKSNAVILGADAVLENGDVINKIGSGMFAEIAFNHNIPVYVITNSLKFTERLVKIEYRLKKEVWDTNKRNLDIKNPAFEIVKSKFITKIISDLGILSPNEFVREAKKFRYKKLICLDMDNTLVYSDKAHVEAFNHSLRDLDFDTVPFMAMAKHFGKPKEEAIRAFSGSNDIRVINKINNLHDKYLYENTKRFCKKVPYADSVLKKLKEDYFIAVLSNCSHKNIETILSAAGYDMDLFDIIIGNDDVKRSKPHPDEILKAQKLLDVNAEFMVGDSIYDIIAARKAKVKPISVLTGLYSKEVLEKEKPYKIIKDLRGLLKIV
jgi:translation initiation factor 2B subunit (eIF-2B alpha/beta/delta family)